MPAESNIEGVNDSKKISEKKREKLYEQIDSLNITTKGIFKKMNFSTKWNIRDIIRKRVRTLTAIVGVTCCCMLIVCAIGMVNSIDYFINLQFDTLYNFDYKLSL